MPNDADAELRAAITRAVTPTTPREKVARLNELVPEHDDRRKLLEAIEADNLTPEQECRVNELCKAVLGETQ